MKHVNVGPALVVATLCAMSSHALGNGRPPASTNVFFHPGEPEEIYVGLTFGLLISKDEGRTFRWVCEQNIGYGGDYDPDYEIAQDGTIYASTTQAGLRVSHDGGCNFVSANAAPAGDGTLTDYWIGAVEVAPDGTVWVATSETGQPNGIFMSTDRGATLVPAGLGSDTAWYRSILLAPSDPSQLYVSGYEVAPEERHFIYRSNNQGQTWVPTSMEGIQLATSRALVMVEAIDPLDPEIFYVRSIDAAKPDGDRLYRTSNGGQSWTEVLTTDYRIRGFVVDGDNAYAVTLEGGGDARGCMYRSSDRGVSFGSCEPGPLYGCLGLDGDELIACADNWEPDFFTLGRSTDDGDSWDPMLRFHHMAGPLSCPQDSVQYTECELTYWPGIRTEFGVTGPFDAGPGDGPDAGDGGGGGGDGCCDARSGAGGSAALALMVAAMLRRRRGYGSSGTSRQLG